jgi:hypothetical protein
LAVVSSALLHIVKNAPAEFPDERPGAVRYNAEVRLKNQINDSVFKTLDEIYTLEEPLEPPQKKLETVVEPPRPRPVRPGVPEKIDPPKGTVLSVPIAWSTRDHRMAVYLNTNPLTPWDAPYNLGTIMEWRAVVGSTPDTNWYFPVEIIRLRNGQYHRISKHMVKGTVSISIYNLSSTDWAEGDILMVKYNPGLLLGMSSVNGSVTEVPWLAIEDQLSGDIWRQGFSVMKIGA